MRHNGPIHKIVFDFSEEVLEFIFSKEFDYEDIDNLLSDNLNQWFLLVTQNSVEEIDISYYGNAKCRVPICIFSCPTLKRLRLRKVSVELINAYCVLPNVTSLCLNDIDFKPRNCSNYVVYLPMLQYLSFDYCDGICYFNIVAPKLGSLKIILYDCSPYYHKKFGVLPPNLDLRSISSFDLSCSPCCFECFNLNPEDFVLMEELSSVARTLKMLRILKFSPFFGSRSQMQSIKALLACFPEIKKVVIVRDWIDRFRPDEKFKIKQELLDFSRASTKPEIFYV
nr:F-box/FBD/LRR-repeat protein At1g13570-like isoform X1 [Ipomoea batatas]